LEVRKECRELFKITNVWAHTLLGRPKPNPISNEPGPLFFAIVCHRDSLHKWHGVHDLICEAVADAYPERDPPLAVRWIVEQNAIGF
jgi:hypothetical protein